MNIEHDRFVRGFVLRHRSWTLLVDRLGCWIVNGEGRVTCGLRWWR